MKEIFALLNERLVMFVFCCLLVCLSFCPSQITYSTGQRHQDGNKVAVTSTCNKVISRL